jgi:hypothetical protein
MPQHAGGCGYQEAMSAYRSPSSAAAPDTCARSWELGVCERSCWSFHCMKKEQEKEEEEEEKKKKI